MTDETSSAAPAETQAPAPQTIDAAEQPATPTADAAAPAPVAETQASEPAPPVAEEPADGVQVDDTDTPEQAPSRAEAFAAKLKQRVRDRLAKEPHRGTPGFEDLLAAVDALIDGLVEGD